jgi:ubiquinone/menaquinone biosynthesis C-methylase UbiE
MTSDNKFDDRKTDTMEGHWNEIYATRELEGLGWYEDDPTPCLKMLTDCCINPEDIILDVGVGASMLIDRLIEQGYQNIVAVDISAEALEKLKSRLGEEKASLVMWIVDDITQPEHLQDLREVAVWHDRALLHFLTNEDQRSAYLATLKSVVKQGGHVIIAAFSLDGAKKCSGLEIRNYNQNMLKEFLGEDFVMIDCFDYMYCQPSGDPRPYIYTLFQKVH